MSSDVGFGGLAPAIAAVLGLIVGSFLNVLIHRLPRMLERQWDEDAATLKGEPLAAQAPFNLCYPRSHCPACGRTLGAAELWPVASWALQRGRCRGCASTIPWRYPLVELLTAALFALIVWRFGSSVHAAALMVFSATLLACAAIDHDTHLLPDLLTLPLMWAGLLVNLGAVCAPLDDAVIGAAAGYGFLWLTHHAFRWLSGREGMGYGDFKLLAALGAWLGWQALPALVLIACASGATVALAQIGIGRRGRHEPIPFGPWLSMAGLWIALTGNPMA